MKNMKSLKTLSNNKGSIALISVLVICAIMILFTVRMSESNISTMYQYLNNESSQIIYRAAESCLEESILRIEKDTSFSGTTLNLGDATCVSTVTGSDVKTISIVINYNSYTQNYSAEASVTTGGNANNIELQKWEKT